MRSARVEEDETLDRNARDADGLTALHHAFITLHAGALSDEHIT